MSTLKVDTVDGGGTAINFPNGLDVSGGNFEQGYTSSATQPTGAVKGDLWWDSANSKLYQYINSAFALIPTAEWTDSWEADLSSITYDSLALSTLSKQTVTRSHHISADGNYLYFVGSTNTQLTRYVLSTPYSLSGASSATQNGLTGNGLSGIAYSEDGTLFTYAGYGDDTIRTQQPTTAWGIDGSVIASHNMTGTWSASRFLTWGDNGSKLYVVDGSGDSIYQYSCPTAYSVAGWSFVRLVTTAAYETSPYSISFTPNGKTAYVCGSTGDDLHRLTLTTAWDLSTATLETDTFSFGQDARGATFSTDGTKMYMLTYEDDTIRQYSTGL